MEFESDGVNLGKGVFVYNGPIPEHMVEDLEKINVIEIKQFASGPLHGNDSNTGYKGVNSDRHYKLMARNDSFSPALKNKTLSLALEAIVDKVNEGTFDDVREIVAIANPLIENRVVRVKRNQGFYQGVVTLTVKAEAYSWRE